MLDDEESHWPLTGIGSNRKLELELWAPWVVHRIREMLKS